ncbi:MAG: tRNA(Ile)(2)-agmatinylcytidine synthase [Candidatus Altiarchaeota archaeon]|nr:tRNA(Ile)(2)-agmatinylcytidine synthase [Candidatus Altiarchaeota archaeon]
MFVGIDDTDSIKGMCTTYLAAKLCHELDIIGSPKLVRLNPNIPYKTRGNAAIAFETNDLSAKKKVISLVKKYSMVSDSKTNPGVVFLESKKVPKKVKDFYSRVVSELVSIEDAEKVISAIKADTFKLKNGRGIIGALAAIGFNGEKTYEIIAYRKSKKEVKERKISRDSVVRMNDLFFPGVFDNLDVSGKRILITPKGRDPIFCGIRGRSKNIVCKAWDMIEPLEPIEFTQLFETNQATDAHLRIKKISEIKPYDCVIVSGTVSSNPKRVPGGHVIFGLTDKTGSIECAAYKPSRDFRDIASFLAVGDEIKVYGGISKYVKTINLEKIEVIRLNDILSSSRPVCCNKNMSSAGRNKGFKCKKCSKKILKTGVKISQKNRSLFLGIYDVPAGSRRHLSKPVFLD